MPRKLTKEEFIKKANIIHNNLYIYDKVDYMGNKSEVIIRCKEHGYFKQRPDVHLQGQKCYRCSKTNNYNDFLIKANKIHSNKYEYPKFSWNISKDKIDIICNKHGIFRQVINYHLNGSGCPICNKKILIESDFLIKANYKFNNAYNYNIINFKPGEKIEIICKIHGMFRQSMRDHLNSTGCPICNKTVSTTEEFIEKSNNIHNFLYDYSSSKYTKSNEKVKIICKKHGEFEQSPNHHLRGNGCPNCNKSKGEIKIKNYLITYNIVFISQFKFYNCKDNQQLPFDFYLPDYNICIEFDGEQHFRTSKFFGGEEKLKRTQLHDKIKTDYCNNNNIRLIRIKYNENILDKLSKIEPF